MAQKKQTWQQWARACAADPSSPSALFKGSLAALTGQDTRALNAIVACWELYACSDEDGQASAILAAGALVQAMQESTRWIARELIPFALDWGDRERLWSAVGVVVGNKEFDLHSAISAAMRRLHTQPEPVHVEDHG